MYFRGRRSAFLLSPTLTGISFGAEPEDAFYGLGEKSGALNRRGRTWEMWNSDEPRHTPERDPLYVSIPLLYHKHKSGFSTLFLDEPGRSWFDLADSSPDCFTLAAPLSAIRFYLWSGKTLREALAPYLAMTGTSPLPPLWSLGYHQSRYSYMSETEVREIAGEFRQREIPCDVIHLDIDYMERYRVFTWNKKRFPDPEALSSDLAKEGFRTVTIIDPGVGVEGKYRVYREGLEGNHFLTGRDGKPYIGAVWPGKAAYPDFIRRESRSWWAKEIAGHLRRGVSGIWNDMNEPSDFTGDKFHRSRFTVPDSVKAHAETGEVPFPEVHNLYGQGMCMATREGFEEARPTERPFVLSRAGYAGIQRHAALWTGDNNSWWEHMAMSIPMLLGLGISGVPFAGADAGGFQSNADGELFARWIACAAFTPFFRGHSASDTRRHEPWAFGEEVEKAARKAIGMRYRFLPLIYSLFYEASEKGTPIMRPLFWEFPEDEASYRVSDQYLFGPDILVAPVCTPGAAARAVYLPPGEWEEFESRERFTGGRYILAEAPLDRLPLFIRLGSIIPLTKVAQHTTDAMWDPLQLHVYLPGAGSASGSCRVLEDDGISRQGSAALQGAAAVAVQGAGQAAARISRAVLESAGEKRFLFSFRSEGSAADGEAGSAGPFGTTGNAGAAAGAAGAVGAEAAQEQTSGEAAAGNRGAFELHIHRGAGKNVEIRVIEGFCEAVPLEL
jgi:alpha-glucosidase